MSAMTIPALASHPVTVPGRDDATRRASVPSQSPHAQAQHAQPQHARPQQPRPQHPAVRPGRPSRGTGRGTAPSARPRTNVAAPQLNPLGRAVPRACAAPGPGVRLTERGIAVVLVVGLMVVMAALVVVSATALRVTGENFRPTTVSHQVAPMGSGEL
ncbi:hypothetical protein GCM10009841_20500 [Microlunatus panaciterrae]|uniref:Uncharacterized protein n=1 Tax=Microlunatus panaciterrae TaxID=400768 RepID=A0ABS2RNL5_9ACTN|nr:hypothetical protein [Microlunatus panaciterrae]MBM7800604.1 hypothetical protein [Microlunatus panaciterrae]